MLARKHPQTMSNGVVVDHAGPQPIVEPEPREWRIGHYGRGPGAQRLLPAPPESDG